MYDEHFVERKRQLFRFNENASFDEQVQFSRKFFQKALERVQYPKTEENEFHWRLS